MTCVSAQRLRSFVTSTYAAVGVPQADAVAIAQLQVEADLRGADGHGVFRLAAGLDKLAEELGIAKL